MKRLFMLYVIILPFYMVLALIAFICSLSVNLCIAFKDSWHDSFGSAFEHFRDLKKDL